MKLIKLASGAVGCTVRFCLKNTQACLYSGMPESDPRQEPKGDI